MGRGLVEPVDDMEQASWHPDLLDWLAEDLVAHGYDLKQTMTRDPDVERVPARGGRAPDSRRRAYVFRGPETRRMTAEQFVDAVSAVTGVWQTSPDARVNAALVPSHAVPPADRTRGQPGRGRSADAGARTPESRAGRHERAPARPRRCRRWSWRTGRRWRSMLRAGREQLLEESRRNARAIVDDVYRARAGARADGDGATAVLSMPLGSRPTVAAASRTCSGAS